MMVTVGGSEAQTTCADPFAEIVPPSSAVGTSDLWGEGDGRTRR
jgi:hypothetical protein